MHDNRFTDTGQQFRNINTFSMKTSNTISEVNYQYIQIVHACTHLALSPLPISANVMGYVREQHPQVFLWKPFRIAAVRYFTGQMPFLLPNQQCQKYQKIQKYFNHNH